MKYNEDGTLAYAEYYWVWDESIEAGYFFDDKEFLSSLEVWYDRIEDEIVGKALIERQVQDLEKINCLKLMKETI